MKSYVSMGRIKDRSKVEYDRSKLCEILKARILFKEYLFHQKSIQIYE